MILKTGPIKEEDFYVDLSWRMGWMLIAPYVVMKLDVLFSREIEAASIYVIYTPLGMDTPFSYDDWCRLPKSYIEVPKSIRMRNKHPDYFTELADWARGNHRIKRLISTIQLVIKHDA